MTLLVNPPSDPMANARLFLDACYVADGQQVLRFHGGIFRSWSGSAWPELQRDDLTAEIYSFFEGTVYDYRVSREVVIKKPFHPSRSKVKEIAAAIAAVSNLSGSRTMPFWIGGDEGEPVDLAPQSLVPMANGLLEVETRVLHDPAPGFFCPYALPYEYSESAPVPYRFLQFLQELWPDDTESQNLLLEFLGYLLVPDTSQQKMLLLVGPPRSGKGTISRVIRDLVGQSNVAGPTLASLATNFGLQPLIDRPVAIIPDARLSGRNSPAVVERLLSISGEDALTIDRKYKSAVTGPLPSRVVILTNELPKLDDASGALANRFLILKMERSFLEIEDHQLGEDLRQELPGILLLALEGLDRLRGRGHFIQPTRSIQVLSDLEELSSPMQSFIRDCCVVDPSEDVSVAGLFDAWRRWCAANGVEAGTIHTFGRDLHSVVPNLKTAQKRVPGGRERRYQGIGLARDGTRS